MKKRKQKGERFVALVRQSIKILLIIMLILPIIRPSDVYALEKNNINYSTAKKAEKLVKIDKTKIFGEDIHLERDMEIDITTNISKETFREIILNMKYDYTGFFERNADFIYDTCKEYQINEIFFCGIIAYESGWGSSEVAIATNNYTSQMDKNGKLHHFDSEEECIISTAESLRENYLNEDGKYYNGNTINGVNVRYCPPIEEGNYEWADKVYSCMDRILN